MNWTLAPAVLLEVALLASVLRKATNAAPSIELRNTLKVTPRLWSTIGVLEGCAVVGLAVGLARPWVGVAAGSGSALLMLGAILAHLRVGLAGRRLLAPAVLMACAIVAGLGFASSL